MKDFGSAIAKGLAELDLEPSGEVVDEFVRYHRELIRWSGAYNITGLKDEKDILTELFLDSALYLKYIPCDASRLLDVGTGGGFPGMVIKILRKEMEVTLLEPSGKKVAFLNHMASKLHLEGLHIYQKRLEEFVKDFGGEGFHVITTKALFRTAEFVRKSHPLLAEEGIVLLSKGKAYEKEVEEFNKHRGLSSYFDLEISEATIPFTEIKRYLIIVRKKGS